MREIARRVRTLEVASASAAATSEIWHQLMWDVGQPWDDVLASYGEDRIKPGENIILIRFVDADDGRPVIDPIRERDRAKAEAWLDAQEAAAP